MTEPQATAAPAGWYPDTTNPGHERFWTGVEWAGTRLVDSIQVTPYAELTRRQNRESQKIHHQGPLRHRSLDVKREVGYVRQQKGHSLTLHLLLGIVVLWVNVIYISVSPNHYWHI